MGKFLLLSIIIATCISALARPWTGIITYYLFALLGPQYIWWWNFEGLRSSLLVAVFTITGIAVKILKGECDYSFLKTRLNKFVLLLWLFIVLSYYFGPYVPLHDGKGLPPAQIFSIVNNVFLFYFCATLAINDTNKIKFFYILFVISTVYLIYWANTQYITSNWAQFNMGRLMGPKDVTGGGLYGDENVFATLFVTGIPFIYYLGFAIRKKVIRLALWCTIPLGWHAIFLTGSRGGLLGLGLITLLFVLKSRRRILAVPVVMLLLIFYRWQAGNTMMERSNTIANYQGEAAAETRITAWKGGLRMIEAHPFSGVGLGTFATALPVFIESKPRIAHNTFINFAAESGFGAGICYLVLICTFAINAVRLTSAFNHAPYSNLALINNACSISFAGLIVCSIFLSLNYYEMFFYLLALNNSLTVVGQKLCKDDKAQYSEVEDNIQ